MSKITQIWCSSLSMDLYLSKGKFGFLCFYSKSNRYKYDQNDDEGIQQGFALQYTSRENIRFLIEFHSSIPL